LRSVPLAVETLRRTPLHDRHAAAGARLVPFAGWEMPVQYEGIRQEHVAVLTRAGLFDVSHMGEIETGGPQAEAFLQRLLSNDVTKIADGGAQYSVLCREDGGELLIPPEGAGTVWDTLTGDGATPAGLGARDTLRLEVCFHLYGNDLSEDRDPISAGLGWCCKRETGFIGADALPDEPTERLAPFAFTGPGVPRQGNAVLTEAGEGLVTSGTMSPCLGV